MKTYKEFNGTSYDEGTAKEVIAVLDRMIGQKTRIRIFLGNTDTGYDWGEEYDVTGTVSRSMGPQKVPLLIASNRSHGGGAILTNCIVRIDCKTGTMYQHPLYQKPEYELEEGRHPLPWKATRMDCLSGDHVSSFETEQKAKNWVAFMRGERWGK